MRVQGRILPRRAICCSQPFAEPASIPFQHPVTQQPEGLLDGFCPEPHLDEQIAFNSNGRLLVLALADIDWLEAAGCSVALHVGEETYQFNDTLTAVIAKLPPGRFLRIGPAALVNYRQIKRLQPMCRGEWQVLLRNGTRLVLAHDYGEQLRQAGRFLAAVLAALPPRGDSPFRAIA